MGNSSCTQLCLNEKTKTDIELDQIRKVTETKSIGKYATVIHSAMKAFKFKKKVDAPSTILNVNVPISLKFDEEFEEGWNIFFQNKEDVDFSFSGVNTLYIHIGSFYKTFFNAEKIKEYENLKLKINEKELLAIENEQLFHQIMRVPLLKNMQDSFDLGLLDQRLAQFEVEFEKCNFTPKVQSESPEYQKDNPIGMRKATEFDSIWQKVMSTGSGASNRLCSSSPKNMLKINPNIAGRSLSPSLKGRISLGKKDSPIKVIKLVQQTKKLKLVKDKKINLEEVIQEIKNLSSKECRVLKVKDENTSIFYEGSWDNLNNKKVGLGYEFMIDNNKGTRYKYCGYYKNNLFHGIGIYIEETGYVYKGEFRKGLKHGYGIEIAKENIYEGFFFHGKYSGYGRLKSSRSTYIGGFKYGLKEGLGYKVCNDGSTYCGQFADDLINGMGLFIWSSGHRYYGSWVNDKMEGIGEYTWSKGDKYKGEYLADHKHGQGEYHFKNNAVLEGVWVKGLKEGKFYLTTNEGKMVKYALYYKNDVQVK